MKQLFAKTEITPVSAFADLKAMFGMVGAEVDLVVEQIEAFKSGSDIISADTKDLYEGAFYVALTQWTYRLVSSGGWTPEELDELFEQIQEHVPDGSSEEDNQKLLIKAVEENAKPAKELWKKAFLDSVSRWAARFEEDGVISRSDFPGVISGYLKIMQDPNYQDDDLHDDVDQMLRGYYACMKMSGFGKEEILDAMAV